VLLAAAHRSTAQQPVVIEADARSFEPAAPLRSPEPLPPGTPQRLLSLADLEHMALSVNPAVIRASALVGAAQGNRVQVGLLPNPSIGYDGQQLGSGGRAEQHGVIISQEIVRGGKLRLNRAVAEQEWTLAEQELAVTQQRVLTDVRIAFYQVLLAQRQIDLTENLVRISRQGAAAVDALVTAEEATRADVLQAQLEIENSQVLARNARNRHEAAWRELSAVVGQAELPEQALDGDGYAPPRDFDFRDVLSRLQSTSPEVAVAMSEISRARAMFERARVEPIPNISVQGLVNVVDNGIGGKPDAGVAVSVPIPLFNRNQGAVLKAQHEIAAAEQALAQLELGMQTRLAPVFERYSNAKNQVERYHNAILPAAQETLDLTRQTYEAGETNFLALLTAQRTFSQTNLNYLEALRELRIAEIEIDGLLLRDSLTSPPGW